MGKIGQPEQGLVELLFGGPGVGVQRLDPVPGGLQRGEKIIGGKPFPFAAGYFLALGVAFGLETLGFGDQGPPAAVELADLIERGTEPGITSSQESGAAFLRALPEQPQVNHFSGRPGSRLRYPQLMFASTMNVRLRSSSFMAITRSLA